MAMLPEGGWMSDYDLFPLNFTGTESYDLVRKNGNGRFTSYAHVAPALVYASKTEWQRMVEMLMEQIPIFSGDLVTDMYVFKELIMIRRNDVGVVYEPEVFVSRKGFRNYKEDGHMDCEGLKGVKAVHFSHFTTGEAYKQGLFPIKEGAPVQNRGLAAGIFMDDYKNQCVGAGTSSTS